MPLQFWNTLTRKKEIFEPIDKCSEDKRPLARIYTCGPTVYDFAHIGNLRTYAFEDLLRRYLKWKGYNVKQVMNITDIDDKTIRGCQEKSVSLPEYTEKYTEAFREDLRVLNIEEAEHYPRATKHIDEMVEIIQKLLSLGIAYRGDDGSIYYDIKKFPEYGKLAHLDMTGLRPGARVSHDEYDKENLSDFALWKAWDEADGPVFWETSLGKGRPGWHIECSAMSMKYLGESFDIHCGGVDNIFPHHQNEIAQSEAYSGKKFVNYWLHSEHLIVDGKKMSKSLGNFYTLRDLLNKGFDPMAIRYLYISSHYKAKLNFTFQTLEAAQAALDRLRQFYLLVSEKCTITPTLTTKDEIEISQIKNAFEEAMDDDLNSPEAFGILFQAIREWNDELNNGNLLGGKAMRIKNFISELEKNLLALNIKKHEIDILPPELSSLLKEREKARKDKNWKRADEIRKELEEQGVILEDTPSGTRWKSVITQKL